jgi:hypothetical protein
MRGAQVTTKAPRRWRTAATLALGLTLSTAACSEASSPSSEAKPPKAAASSPSAPPERELTAAQLASALPTATQIGTDFTEQDSGTFAGLYGCLGSDSRVPTGWTHAERYLLKSTDGGNTGEAVDIHILQAPPGTAVKPTVDTLLTGCRQLMNAQATATTNQHFPYSQGAWAGGCDIEHTEITNLVGAFNGANILVAQGNTVVQVSWRELPPAADPSVLQTRGADALRPVLANLDRLLGG